MKNPFQTGETFMEKMNKNRTKTPEKTRPVEQKATIRSDNLAAQRPSSPKLKSNFLAKTHSMGQTDPIQPTRHQVFNQNAFLKKNSYQRQIPEIKCPVYDYQKSNDLFSQQRSDVSNRFEDISLNIPLSPIASARNEDISVLPLTDSMLMQCLAKTDTRDELCKLLGINHDGVPVNDASAAIFKQTPSYNSNHNPVRSQPNSNLNYASHNTQDNFRSKTEIRHQQYIGSQKPSEQDDKFDFQEFENSNSQMADSILQHKLPQVMKYQPLEQPQKQIPLVMYETLPRFNQEVILNFKVNLLDRINKQMEPLYQKDVVRVFLTHGDKVTMKRYTLTQ